MRNSGIVNNVDAQTIEFDEDLLIEGYLEQAKEALQLAEEAMHAVFEADSLEMHLKHSAAVEGCGAVN